LPVGIYFPHRIKSLVVRPDLAVGAQYRFESSAPHGGVASVVRFVHGVAPTTVRLVFLVAVRLPNVDVPARQLVQPVEGSSLDQADPLVGYAPRGLCLGSDPPSVHTVLG